MHGQEPSLADIYLARRRIHNLVFRTPLIESPTLSKLTGSTTYLKLENLQKTGSFKLRGATNKIKSLAPEALERGVITVSSGNHGLAVSYAARDLGVPAYICVSSATVEYKVAAIRNMGSEILMGGGTYDEAAEFANQKKNDLNLTMIHPFDDPEIIAGQGTIGLEIIEELPEIDTVLVPLSGGGLMSGIALALKTIKPSIHVVGVSMALGPAMVESIKAGRIEEVDEQASLADALVGGLGRENHYTMNMVKKYADETVLVSEDEIAAGMVFALENHHQVLEGGGAVGIAALMAKKVGHLGKHVVIVASGGNVSLPVLMDLAQNSRP
ncbi:MAG: threonine/serine dehydratase [Anaerolineales bacterium]|nr:threonine/serine dehydratase [Anaerolineales bacterium]